MSPRGVIALTWAACAYALIDGRGWIMPEDLKALAEPVFAHRLLLTSDAQVRGVTPPRCCARRSPRCRCRCRRGRSPRPGFRAEAGRTDVGITARGAGLLVAAVVLLVVGFRFAYPELTLLGAAGAVAVGYALLVALWRPRLEVTRHADPDRVARGEPARMVLTVRNAGRLRAANLLAEDRCGGRTVPVPVLRLRPGRDTTISYDVPTDRRGVVPVGPLRVTRRDPLGLVALARPYSGTVPVWVHPRIHPLTAVPRGRGAAWTAGWTGCRTGRSRSTRCGSTWSATSCAGCTGAPAPGSVS